MAILIRSGRRRRPGAASWFRAGLCLLAVAAGLSCAPAGRELTKLEDPDRMQAIRDLYTEGDYRDTIFAIQDFLGQRPGSKYAEEALYLLARSYYEEGLDIEAEERFRELRRNFSGGEYGAEATYYLSLTLLSQSRKAELDQTETRESLALMNYFVRAYPEHELVPRAEMHIVNMRTKLAAKQFKNGELYDRMGRRSYSAAVRYFEDVVYNYPGTEWAVPAMLRLAGIHRKTKAWDLAYEWGQRIVDEHPEAPEAGEAAEIVREAVDAGYVPEGQFPAGYVPPGADGEVGEDSTSIEPD